jgi:hypothetical protein
MLSVRVRRRRHHRVVDRLAFAGGILHDALPCLLPCRLQPHLQRGSKIWGKNLGKEGGGDGSGYQMLRALSIH